MRAIILLLLLVVAAHAETFHLWRSEPVEIGGRRVGAWSPYRTESGDLATTLRSAGHTVIAHNAVTEPAPGVRALPAITVIDAGVHVPVLVPRVAGDLSAARLGSAAVTAAKNRAAAQAQAAAAAKATARLVELYRTLGQWQRAKAIASAAGDTAAEAAIDAEISRVQAELGAGRRHSAAWPVE